MNYKYWLALGVTAVSLTAAGPTEVTIQGDKPFPESITSTSEGVLFMGSITQSEVFRAAKDSATAEPWIKPGTNGLQRILGVLADQKSDTLWVCSSKAAQGPPTALKAFNLKTGAPKWSYDFPGDNALCNDIAVGRDGDVYATDTIAARVLRLKKGATALDIWLDDKQLAGIDGIAFGDDDTIYVNTVTTGHLFRIPVGKDGAAGVIAPIQPSQPLSSPDGMRSLAKNQFLLVEGAGQVDRVTIDGANAKIEVLKAGFNGPTAVTQVGKTAWVLEGKLKYMNDPKFKDQDPGPFKAYAVPIPGKH
jgi:sugar lactone lactonase YvrE